MKHLLIILISILLLSSPVIGDNHKGETLYQWENPSSSSLEWVVWKGNEHPPKISPSQKTPQYRKIPTFL